MSESPSKVSWPIRLILLTSLSLFLVVTLTEYNRVRGLDIAPMPETSRSTNDFVIIPGVRVGQLTLGLSTSQVRKILGKGKAAPHPDGQILLYPDHGLALYFERDRLNSVTVRNPAFETKQQIKVGASADTALEALGKNYEMDGNPDEYTLHAWEKGLHVSVKDGQVTHLLINAGIEIPVSDEVN